MTTIGSSSALICAMIGLMLMLIAVYQGPLLELVERVRQHQQYQDADMNEAPVGIPLPPFQPYGLLIISLGGGVLTAVSVMQALGSQWWLLSMPGGCLGTGILWLRITSHRQERRLNQQLALAAAEIAAAMNSQQTLNAALKETGALLQQPLATPWNWMTSMAGAALITGDGRQRFLQMKDSAQLLASTTSNHVLRRFLEHIEACADLPHAGARDRLQAVSEALYRRQIQEQQLRARLAHARTSALVVLAVGLGMALFLRLSMAERWALAFNSSLGRLATVGFGLLFLAPVIGIVLLSQAPELDF